LVGPGTKRSPLPGSIAEGGLLRHEQETPGPREGAKEEPFSLCRNAEMLL